MSPLSLRCVASRALASPVLERRCARSSLVPQARASRRRSAARAVAPSTARKLLSASAATTPGATSSSPPPPPAPASTSDVDGPSSSAAAASSSDSAEAAAAALAASFFDRGDSRPILLFDARCNLCNGGVDAARALDKKGDAARLRFAALQSPAGRALLASAARRSPDDLSSVVLVEAPDRAFVRSEAVVRAARAIGAPPALLAAALAGPVPLGARDSAYDAVADNRYALFGRSSEERWTREGEAEGRFLVE